ncbi:MAG: flagellar biosynthesis protein FlhA [candidate division Zixibacteria bacterium]|nr:flagellar biosynthesis protein FlhA [candidate division Zixibacteria bacterium]MDH3936547.1 flagellar biosynthesis protein FlhA [candidate division Zixibacteria bacterium]MDH4032290.1 flagellar biosynthesis protein FlhA [candidate division Zixibacteria bacterium]
MATQAPKRTLLEAIASRSDVILALAVVGIIAVLIIPIPTGLLDFALAFNITFSLVVLLTTLYITRPLDLSVFPSMLLIVTLMRLSLNVASTRLILGHAYAGEVINSFGDFVVQGNYVVGFIVFVILVIIQFVVITKGATRISEVAARFTLDAMPGKQMAIDADLNAGIINDEDARTRREDIAREADFYGAMDGASKFVRGDAVAGILITLINIIGGFVIGIALNDMSLSEALRTYSLLSIGDGLVTQIPALLVSTASGIIVTRAAARDHMGKDLGTQLTRQPRAILVASVVLFGFGLLPGMPTTTFIILALLIGGIGFVTREMKQRQRVQAKQQEAKKEAQQTQVAEERTEDLLKVDALGLEIGYGLIGLVDAKQGGDLLNRIGVIRKQLAGELGIVVPPIRIRDNVQLRPNEYRIKVKGITVATFELMVDHLLAINPGFVEEKLEGFETRDPAFDLEACWIIPNLKEIAEAKGYTVVEPSAVMATHMTEVVRNATAEILSRQDVQHLVDTLKEDFPALVDSTIPELVSLGTLQKVLKALLKERVPVRDLATILETISDYITATKEPDVLAEYVRMALRRQITELYKDKDGKINVFTIDPAVEQQLGESVQNTKQGLMLVLDPAMAEKLLERIGEEMKRPLLAGFTPVCLSSPNIRLALRRLVEARHPQLAVVSYNEVMPEVELISTGMVRLEDDN